MRLAQALSPDKAHGREAFKNEVNSLIPQPTSRVSGFSLIHTKAIACNVKSTYHFAPFCNVPSYLKALQNLPKIITKFGENR